jgi:osmotically-inducible protein OsmY
MHISSVKKDWVLYAYLGALVCALGGVPTRVDAQNASAPAFSRSVSIAASTKGAADWVADEELRKRVKASLHTDPYFYDDEHVAVSIENGGVVLRGFVLSDWDLQEALRIAKKAAGDRPVIDNLSIKEGGRR